MEYEIVSTGPWPPGHGMQEELNLLHDRIGVLAGKLVRLSAVVSILAAERNENYVGAFSPGQLEDACRADDCRIVYGADGGVTITSGEGDKRGMGS